LRLSKLYQAPLTESADLSKWLFKMYAGQVSELPVSRKPDRLENLSYGQWFDPYRGCDSIR